MVELVCTKYPVPKKYKKCAIKTKEFVNSAVEFIKNNPSLSNEEIFAELSKLETPYNYYVVYGNTCKNKGILLYHGPSGFLSQEDPCGKDKPPVGNNLWNYKSLNGEFSVRIFYEISKRGCGWYSYYWINPLGNISPKYHYIVNVPERDFLISSGFNVFC